MEELKEQSFVTRSQLTRSAAVFWMLVLLGFALLASVVAVLQPGVGPIFLKRSLWELLIYPTERNAFLRLAAIEGNLHDIAVVENKLWVVGEQGLIAHSADAGKTWSQQSWPDGRTFDESSLVSQAPLGLVSPIGSGFISQAQAMEAPIEKKIQSNPPASSLTVQKTVQNKSAASPPESTTVDRVKQDQSSDSPSQSGVIAEVATQPQRIPDLHAVAFPTAERGFAVGEFGTLLRTRNGGQSWETVKPEGEGLWGVNLKAIHFFGARYGWILGEQGVLLRTIDGGEKWFASMALPRGKFESIWFSNSNEGWAVGADGMIASSSDGGASWHQMPTVARTVWHAVQTDASGKLWVSGDRGQLLKRDEMGQARLVSTPAQGAVIALRFGQGGLGIALTDQGEVIKTQDGGVRWTVVNPGTFAVLRSLALMESGEAWFAGEAGSVVHVTASGHWHNVTQGRKTDFLRVKFIDAKRGFALTADNIFYRTGNAGRSWQATRVGAELPLVDFDFRDAQTGVLLDQAGGIFITRDAGTHWAKREVPLNAQKETVTQKSAPLSSGNGFTRVFYFSDQLRALGPQGVLMQSMLEGGAWRAVDIPGVQPINAVMFLPDGQGWMAGEYGYMARSTNGQAPWALMSRFTQSALTDIRFVDEAQGWAVADGREVFYTNDGGLSWRREYEHSGGGIAALHARQQVGSVRAWAVSGDGQVLGRREAAQVTLLEKNQTVTPAKTTLWQTMATLPWSLADIFFQDNAIGWVAARGHLLKTQDGGLSWQRLDYKRYPALWYPALCSVFLGFGGFIYFRSRQPGVFRESVADLLASDRPLAPGDPDPLNFGRIARGLSRFMRNPATEPPLTVAVTGEWGTGKSSLMNLLYHDLKNFGFTPVWFNAWHHQKGEQLLASLYANIRAQVVPGWFKFYGLRPIGLLFRLRLLYRRGARQWVLFLLTTALAAAALAYLGRNPGQVDISLLRTVFDVGDEGGGLDHWVLVLLGLSPPVAAAAANLRAFGIHPEKLISLSSQVGSQKKNLDPSARQRMARDFSDVSDCLELGRMVIFIDDLDRCSKDNVVEILEAINFLSVSGNCYIVVGMAETWVKTCVALAFHDLAKNQLGYGPSVGSAALDSTDRLAEFADQYLEKLINIRVPVPTLSQADTENLLFANAPETMPGFAGNFEQRMVSSTSRLWRRYHQALLLGAAVAAGLAVGIKGPTYLAAPKKAVQPQQWPLTIHDLMAVASAHQDGFGQSSILSSLLEEADLPESSWRLVLEADPKSLSQGLELGQLGKGAEKARLMLKLNTQEALSNPSSDTTAAVDYGTDKTVIVPDAGFQTTRQIGVAQLAPQVWSRLLAMPFVLWLAVGIVALFFLGRTNQQVVRDSPEFRKALEIWHAWIVARRLTPRAIKRYLNRVRYIAMCYRPEPPANRGLWWPVFRAQGAQDSGSQETMRESAIVALTAIQVLDESWVLDPEAFEQLSSGQVASMLRSKFPMLADVKGEAKTAAQSAGMGPLIERLSAAINAHQAVFDDGLFDGDALRSHYCRVLAQGHSPSPATGEQNTQAPGKRPVSHAAEPV